MSHPPIAPKSDESPFFKLSPSLTWMFRSAPVGQYVPIESLSISESELCACWQRCGWLDEANRLINAAYSTSGAWLASTKEASRCYNTAKEWQAWGRGE